MNYKYLPYKKRDQKIKDKDKDFHFMNALSGSKNLKVIRKYDKSSKNIISFS